MRGIIAGDNGLIRHARHSPLTCCRCHDRLRSCCAKTGAGGGRDRRCHCRCRRRLPIILAGQTMAQTTTIDDLLRIFRTPKRDDRQSCDRLFGSFVLCLLFFSSFLHSHRYPCFLRGIAPLTFPRCLGSSIAIIADWPIGASYLLATGNHMAASWLPASWLENLLPEHVQHMTLVACSGLYMIPAYGAHLSGRNSTEVMPRARAYGQFPFHPTPSHPPPLDSGRNE